MRKIILFLKRLFRRVNNIFYVGSSDILPEPLSKEEETNYVLLSMNGDEFARNKLIEHNLRLVVFLAKKYENTMVDLEDLVSIGTIGLIKGVNTYKLDKNIKLATYASRCIDNEILMYLRKTKRRRSEVSFEDSLSFDAEGNELCISDILSSENDDVSKNIDKEDESSNLNYALNLLSDKEKEIMCMRYGLSGKAEMTQKQVADYFEISQSYISRIEKKILDKMKQQILKLA